jgi:hypothetical protein
MTRALLFIAGMMMVVGLAATTVNKTVIFTMRSTNRPFDHLGDRIRCQRCPSGIIVAGEGYWYSCEGCGAKYRARCNDETKQIDIDF